MIEEETEKKTIFGYSDTRNNNDDSSDDDYWGYWAHMFLEV